MMVAYSTKPSPFGLGYPLSGAATPSERTRATVRSDGVAAPWPDSHHYGCFYGHHILRMMLHILLPEFSLMDSSTHADVIGFLKRRFATHFISLSLSISLSIYLCPLLSVPHSMNGPVIVCFSSPPSCGYLSGQCSDHSSSVLRELRIGSE
eukprot:sb/3473477/